jgi:hypothetical protein
MDWKVFLALPSGGFIHLDAAAWHASSSRFLSGSHSGIFTARVMVLAVNSRSSVVPRQGSNPLFRFLLAFSFSGEIDFSRS